MAREKIKPREPLSSTIQPRAAGLSRTCHGCWSSKRLLPVLTQLAEEMASKAKIGKVDIASEMPLANRYRVRALPTLLIFKHGEVREQLVGADFTKERLRAKLEAVMG